MSDYPFTTRLVILLSIDTALSVLNAYIPHEWSLVRLLVAIVQLSFMTATMIVTTRRVLEDY
ncbi:MAG: hypothetical protein JWN01_293 [Patescibacteria group bacterium]|nr:hypothetical protein [Patescibacteria group bacterium]